MPSLGKIRIQPEERGEELPSQKKKGGKEEEKEREQSRRQAR